MTGHGRGEARGKEWSAVVECYSVNRKNAEVICHSERGTAWLEPLVRERVLAVIARGRVQVSVALSCTGGTGTGLIDPARAAAFLREARALQASLGVGGEITISDLLTAPGVIRAIEPSGDSAKEVALRALDAALEGLVQTRTKEGAALRRVLAKSARQLGKIVRQIAPLAAKSPDRQREAMLARISRAGIGFGSDDPRLISEIALIAERGDVTEELDRARSHLVQFLEKLDSSEPVGRTLEFLAQELGREFNTVGSKSSDTAIARLVIEAKTELDRIREQLANIE